MGLTHWSGRITDNADERLAAVIVASAWQGWQSTEKAK